MYFYMLAQPGKTANSKAWQTHDGHTYILYLSCFSYPMFIPTRDAKEQSGQKQISSAHSRLNLVKSECQADNIPNSNQIPKPLHPSTCIRFHCCNSSACIKAQANLTDHEYIKESQQIVNVTANFI